MKVRQGQALRRDERSAHTQRRVGGKREDGRTFPYRNARGIPTAAGRRHETEREGWEDGEDGQFSIFLRR